MAEEEEEKALFYCLPSYNPSLRDAATPLADLKRALIRFILDFCTDYPSPLRKQIIFNDTRVSTKDGPINGLGLPSLFPSLRANISPDQTT